MKKHLTVTVFLIAAILSSCCRKEVKDILAYLYVVSNPDDSYHLMRIVNEPKRKLGDSTMQSVQMISEFEEKSLFDIMTHADDYISISKSKTKELSYMQVFDELRKAAYDYYKKS